MKILIHGTGGVGGFFGAKLLNAGEDVWFLARGKHLEVSKAKGIRVQSTQGNFAIPGNRVTGNIAEVGPVDVVLFCVKSYDTEQAAGQLKPVLKSGTVIIPLQNGIDNEEKIQRILPDSIVYGGVAYISTRITAPGEISETGGSQRISFGPMDGRIDDIAKSILAVFQRAGINVELKADIAVELWRKFIFITTMGAFTASSRLTQGEILAVPESIALVFDAMKEVEAVARAKGIGAEPLDREKVIAGLKRFDPNTRSSMYYDLMNGKPLEIEALNGTVVRLGSETGVPTPIHRSIYATLLPYHRKHLQSTSVASPATSSS
jgi:2-dehydropantoate 2-reductase